MRIFAMALLATFFLVSSAYAQSKGVAVEGCGIFSPTKLLMKGKTWDADHEVIFRTVFSFAKVMSPAALLRDAAKSEALIDSIGKNEEIPIVDYVQVGQYQLINEFYVDDVSGTCTIVSKIQRSLDLTEGDKKIREFVGQPQLYPQTYVTIIRKRGAN